MATSGGKSRNKKNTALRIEVCSEGWCWWADDWCAGADKEMKIRAGWMGCVNDDLRREYLSEEEPQDRAARRRLISHIDLT